jgi:CheY-like chemotaxis protein
MPYLDGLGVTSFIRQNSEVDRTLPIVSMTSSSAPGDVWRYLEAGMTDILPKPIARSEMVCMLKVSVIIHSVRTYLDGVINIDGDFSNIRNILLR